MTSLKIIPFSAVGSFMIGILQDSLSKQLPRQTVPNLGGGEGKHRR